MLNSIQIKLDRFQSKVDTFEISDTFKVRKITVVGKWSITFIKMFNSFATEMWKFEMLIWFIFWFFSNLSHFWFFSKSMIFKWKIRNLDLFSSAERQQIDGGLKKEVASWIQLGRSHFHSIHSGNAASNVETKNWRDICFLLYLLRR